MRILVLGANGMLGHKLAQQLSDEFELWATVRSLSSANPVLAEWVGESRLLGDVLAESLGSIIEALARCRPEAVVNCIGIVKQRAKGADPKRNAAVNSFFPHALADLCTVAGSRLIHLSTDCVFSGSRGFYREDDPPDPVDVYGRSKLMGELNRPGCLTLRTSMVGWELAGSAGLLEWFAANRSDKITGYRRAVFSGLTTAALSKVIAYVLRQQPELEGLLHVSAEPINKFELLVKLAQTLEWETEIVPTDEPAIDRSLDSSRFRETAVWSPPSWHKMIADAAAERPLYGRWRNG